MHKKKILDIQPQFQREIVWKPSDQTRFIDSLIKQLPIPSMCFSLDFKQQKWQVIDGLQRIASIIKFLEDETWILSKLDDIDPKISGQSVANFLNELSSLHKFYTRVENMTLPITVLRCDYSKSSHSDYLYTIFHRLNAGGTKLNNQEIRNCIYSGDLNDFLNELNSNEHWMKINRMKSTKGYRFRQQELILRFFAFFDNLSSYNGRLSRFLNDYMGKNRNPEKIFINKKKELFNTTVDIIYKKIFEGFMPTKMKLSVLEGMLIGVARNCSNLKILTNQKVQNLYRKLLDNEEFSDKVLSEGLSGKARVFARLEAAISIFSS